MSGPPSDRALRRMVADLSKAAAEDIEAILAELDAGHRGTVLALLGVYTGEHEKTASSLALEGLSSGLGERLAQAARSDHLAGSPFELTPVAADALRASAQEMLDLGLGVRPMPASAAPPSLLQRLQNVLSGDRRGL